jgi:ribosomal protein S12 methylthiotransferase accessory factor
MTATRKTRVARQTRKDILRFAPNFTAYLLPPDAVCLYSENRKFFLHGELYCALASAIGQHGKARSEIIRQLSKRFPADKIEEAIKRLLDRRYVVARTPKAFDDAVGGFLASLGMPLEIAEQNLRNCPVQVESIDVKGAKELTAALGKLGVQIAKRSPKLTITLVNDYLDGRLARNAWPARRPGCWYSRPARFRWSGPCSNRARAPAGPACSIA